ncbi:FRIGIDA-like protein [Quillaja saponaria]|uniref:FRIGIDA-like protein n=1 Tax=Quillaja saponaria TaxID=32244 RepID=A0AAD7L8Q3_QUISA|nr:FRIGIDA-like protein [Quillaja saponaria]
MADVEQVGVMNDTIPVIEQLGKAFLDLEAYKNASEDKVLWVEIENHFRNLETALKKKLEELEAKEKEFQEKEAESTVLLADREAAVVSKEQDLLDRMQELKDAAVSAIVEARENHQPASLESVDDGMNKESRVSSSLADENSPEEEIPCKSGANAEGVAVDVKPRLELTQFCEQMDAKGLLNYVMENKKNLSFIREELSIALESALEPARLVLDSLEGFYPSDETIQPWDKRSAALQGMHKSCLMFMEAMATLLARADPGAVHLLNPETKQQAKAIADEWKPKLASAGTDVANGNSLEAEAFLQLIATFRIASEFDEEELCKLVLAVAHRRQAPELCRSLGLTHKVPGIIELLVNKGKQIPAVHFSHAFQLSESFPLVPLLKAYLKDLRRNSQGKAGSVAGIQNDANAQELAALKVVIRCVEEYKLESDYPLDPLQRRVAQLEKSKADKKRSGEFGRRQQPKKPRSNGGFFGFRSSSGNAASSAVMGRQAPPLRAVYTGMPERYPPAAGQNAYDYQVPGQTVYAQQANDQRLYYYPPDDRVVASSYNATPSNYGSYVGSSLQSPHQPYM